MFNPNIEPMLCSQGKPNDLESTKYLAQEKFDGHRAIMYIDEDGFTHFYSRRTSKVTGEKEDNTARLNKLCTIFSKFKDSIFDGELVMQGNRTDSAMVQQVLGSTPERAEELWDEGIRLQYKIFDVLKFKGENIEDKTLIERISYLMQFNDYLLQSDSSPLNRCYNVPGFYFRSLPINLFGDNLQRYVNYSLVQVDSFKEEFDILMRCGCEGLILKDPDSTYKQGKRAKEWLKFKGRKTADLVVMGFEPPIKDYTGKFSVEELRKRGWKFWENEKPITKTYAKGWVGGIRLGAYKDGQLTYVTTAKGFSDADQEFIKNHDMSEVVVEVEYQEVINSETKSLRHPRVKEFRFNKDTKECLWENI